MKTNVQKKPLVKAQVKVLNEKLRLLRSRRSKIASSIRKIKDRLQSGTSK